MSAVPFVANVTVTSPVMGRSSRTAHRLPSSVAMRQSP
nr:MAG TPA: hypothetical protein [Caudoviricetes sp.]